MLKNSTKTGFFLSLSLLAAFTSQTTVSSSSLREVHYENERIRFLNWHSEGIANGYYRKTMIQLGSIGLSASWMSFCYCSYKCDDFTATETELRDATTRKKLAMVKDHNKARERTSAAIYNAIRNQASFADSKHLAKDIVADTVTEYIEPKKITIKNISNDDAFAKLTCNDFPRYRKYQHAKMFFAATSFVAAGSIVYHLGKAFTYPDFVFNDYVPNQGK